MLGLPLRPRERFHAVGGVFELLARQQFRDGEDLQARIADAGRARNLEVFFVGLRGFVEARRRSFRKHGLGGLAQGNQRPDGGLFARQHAFQVAHVVHADVSALDLHDDFLRHTALVVEKAVCSSLTVLSLAKD